MKQLLISLTLLPCTAFAAKPATSTAPMTATTATNAGVASAAAAPAQKQNEKDTKTQASTNTSITAAAKPWKDPAQIDEIIDGLFPLISKTRHTANTEDENDDISGVLNVTLKLTSLKQAQAIFPARLSMTYKGARKYLKAAYAKVAADSGLKYQVVMQVGLSKIINEWNEQVKQLKEQKSKQAQQG